MEKCFYIAKNFEDYGKLVNYCVKNKIALDYLSCYRENGCYSIDYLHGICYCHSKYYCEYHRYTIKTVDDLLQSKSEIIKFLVIADSHEDIKNNNFCVITDKYEEEDIFSIDKTEQNKYNCFKDVLCFSGYIETACCGDVVEYTKIHIDKKCNYASVIEAITKKYAIDNIKDLKIETF